MTPKEITALRKAGHLQKALEAAENEFAKNANNYTSGALFWCLNELAKQQYGDDVAITLERLKYLYSNHHGDDEVMEKAITSISRRVQPHFQELSEVIQNAKNGIDISQKYQDFAEMFKTGNLDPSLYSDFGWLIYYALKQAPVDNAYLRKSMLSNYLSLGLPKPSILHSRILVEAIKVEQNTPLQFRIRDFIRMWGLENLRNEDWEQYRTDEGHTLPSSVEKLIGVYAKELKTDRVEAPEDFIHLVDKALIEYPQNQNMPYFKATVLMAQGQLQEALSFYKNMILQFPSKFYLWHQASELVEDIDTKVGLLCKALTCGADDEFLGGVRLKLATILWSKGLGANAKYELDKYKETYQNKGWRLKPEFWEIYNQLLSQESANNNNGIYTEFAVHAEGFIYSTFPTVLAVKVSEIQNEDRNNPSKKITTWVLRIANSTIRLRKPKKFGLNMRTPNGTTFDIKMNDGKIIWINKHTGPISQSWIKENKGKVQLRTDRNGKKYAIIAGSYVGQNLLEGISDGQEIKILSIQQKDGRWSAISIYQP